MPRALIRSGMLVVALALMWTASAVPAARAQDESAHVGVYEYVSGKDAAGAFSKERLVGTVKVTEDRLYLLDDEGQEMFAISFTVDSEETPYKVSMKIERSAMEDAVGATAKALAKHEGDTVTLIYDYSENGDYPSDFEPKGAQHLFVLKKKADAR